MKKPSRLNLRENKEVTTAIRKGMRRQKSVKITLNMDASSLRELRKRSESSGIPYQRLINQIVRDNLAHSPHSIHAEKIEARISKLEKEIRQLKRKRAV